MGDLTTITIYNDALDEFKAYPEAFAKALFYGINEANRTRQSVSVQFRDRTGYITVHPSRHSTDSTLYVHSGNCVVEINPYCKDTERMVRERYGFIKGIVKLVKSDIRNLEKLLAEKKNKTGKKAL